MITSLKAWQCFQLSSRPPSAPTSPNSHCSLVRLLIVSSLKCFFFVIFQANRDSLASLASSTSNTPRILLTEASFSRSASPQPSPFSPRCPPTQTRSSPLSPLVSSSPLPPHDWFSSPSLPPQTSNQYSRQTSLTTHLGSNLSLPQVPHLFANLFKSIIKENPRTSLLSITVRGRAPT